MQPVRLEHSCRSCKSGSIFRIWKHAIVSGVKVKFAECVACNYMNVVSDHEQAEAAFVELEISVVYQQVRCPKCGSDVSTEHTRRKKNFTYRDHKCRTCDHEFRSIDL